jgi:hypothetical protein
MITWAEKRQDPRLAADFQISCRLVDQNDKRKKEFQGKVENISKGGLYFFLSQKRNNFLTIDQILEIIITIPRRNYDLSWIDTLKTQGKIIRIDKLSAKPPIQGVAFQFLDKLVLV